MERGNIHKPTGNAIIYWHLRGNNRLFKDARIIASNFVISPLQVKEENLMVNFPPVLIEDYDELLVIAERNNLDLIKGEDITVPDDIDDITEFYKQQIEKYKGIIQEYVSAFKEKNIDSEVSITIPQLISRSTLVMEKIRTMIKYREKKELIDQKMMELRDLQNRLVDEMPGLRFERLIPLLQRSSPEIDELIGLYQQKLLALFLEDYERAERLKREIREREKMV
jgi:hypothetical protein